MTSNVGNCNRVGPIVSEPINPLHLPWMVYAYGLDGFSQEHALPRNTNVTGYPFPPNT